MPEPRTKAPPNGQTDRPAPDPSPPSTVDLMRADAGRFARWLAAVARHVGRWIAAAAVAAGLAGAAVARAAWAFVRAVLNMIDVLDPRGLATWLLRLAVLPLLLLVYCHLTATALR